MSELLETKSREDLKGLCKRVGVKGYHNWGKSKLIRAIRDIELNAKMDETIESENEADDEIPVWSNDSVLPQLADMSRKDLQTRCKDLGIKGYYPWGKDKMIEEISKKQGDVTIRVDQAIVEVIDADVEVTPEPTPEKVDVKIEVVAQDKLPPIKLTSAAIKWRDYFAKGNTTAIEFLTRYPNHKHRQIIEELLPE